MVESRDFFSRSRGKLVLYIFLIALIPRLVLDLIFFLGKGWFASHLIEIWFYYGVAQGVFSLSPLDPTWLLLRLPGWLLPSSVLYQAVVFQAAAVSALTAVLVFYWLDHWFDRATGWWGGLVAAIFPAPLTLCLVNFSHDIVQAPMVVLFFWSAGVFLRERQVGRKRLVALALCLLFLFLGLKVGPLMAAAFVIVLLYGLWLLYSSIWSGRPPPALAAGLFALVLLLLNLGAFLIMKAHLLEWVAPLALKFRGIDLMAQVKIQVGDLQPLPSNVLWNRYNLFLFFVPWGLWTAFKKREFFGITFLFFSLALSLAVNRGARLLDISMIYLVALSLANWNFKAFWTTLGFLLFFIVFNLATPVGAKSCYLGVPYGLESLGKSLFIPGPPGSGLSRNGALLFFGFLLLAVLWGCLLNSKRRWLLALPVAMAILLEMGWTLLASGVSSDRIEYEAYRWLGGRSAPGEKIFAAWNQGFFIEAVSHLKPVTTPDRIDMELTRLYWVSEEEAYRRLRERGVNFVHLSTRYFSVTDVDRERDTFRLRGNTIIGPRPEHIRKYSQMRRTFLYRLMYDPATLKYFRPIYDEFDRERKVGVRLFVLDPSPDKNIKLNIL